VAWAIPLRNPLPGNTGPLSLLVELLDWLLAPLIILWPLSVVVTFWVANVIANIPYDTALDDSVSALARHVRFEGEGARADLPAGTTSFLRADDLDTTRFQIRGVRGEVLAGDPDLAEIFPAEQTHQLVVYFRDDEWHGEPVRIAYMFIFTPGGAEHRRVLVQVAETLNKRHSLANRIISGIIVPQFFLFPFVAALVWFGLQRGTKPLNDLRERLRSRSPADLSPIDVREVPEEIGPLIEAFNDLLGRLAQTLKSQERFIADAAHQMRTPLAGLRTQLEFALRQPDPRELRASLERIRSSVERAAHVLSQLLSLARSQSGAMVEYEPVDANALVREVTQEFVPQALAKGIDLGFESRETHAWVAGNALLLHELFSNLVDNAIRYTGAGGKVTARVHGGESVVIEVEDNGIGIDEKDRELIFERFYRAQGNDATGSGLGLAIVRSIADQHRAEVTVRSNQPERGSVFTVRFPAYEPARGPARLPDKSPSSEERRAA
jgi:two-component system sensor histidine kinase TctE